MSPSHSKSWMVFCIKLSNSSISLLERKNCGAWLMSPIYLLKFHVMGGLVLWQSLLQVQDSLSLSFISLMWTFPPPPLFCFVLLVWYRFLVCELWNHVLQISKTCDMKKRFFFSNWYMYFTESFLKWNQISYTLGENQLLKIWLYNIDTAL